MKTKTKKEISYVCPHCKEKQYTICEWQKADVGYDFSFETQDFEMRPIDNAEHNEWACSNCGEHIDTKELPKEVREAISDYPS